MNKLQQAPIKEWWDDPVNHPKHYKKGNIETIDYLESFLGRQGFLDYCLGNVLKYVSRWRDKGGVEDLKKAKWYLDRTIKTIDNQKSIAPLSILLDQKMSLADVPFLDPNPGFVKYADAA